MNLKRGDYEPRYCMYRFLTLYRCGGGGCSLGCQANSKRISPLQILDYYPASYHLGEISGVIGFESNAMLLKELAELEQKQSELALDYSNNLLKHISELIEKITV